jgi:hypothetical protein
LKIHSHQNWLAPTVSFSESRSDGKGAFAAGGVAPSGFETLGAGREATARAESRACRRGSEAPERLAYGIVKGGPFTGGE